MLWIPLHQTWQIYWQICWQIHPPAIKHRCLQYVTPNLADLLADPPQQLTIDALNTTTPKLADLLAGLPPQLSIDALNTATPNLADLPPINQAYMPWIPLHQTWQNYPWSIKHRCLEYHYTKLGRSTGRSAGRSTPQQLSIDALNTTTPNLADLLADPPLGNWA